MFKKVKPSNIGVDLHTHTLASDGAWSPSTLVKAALDAQVQILSVCDHETTDNLKPVQILTGQFGLQFISGVEVAIGHRGAVYHLLMYGFDSDNSNLQAMLQETRLNLWHKKRLMAANLRKQGYQLPEYPANSNPGSTSPVYELARELVAAVKNQSLTFAQAWELCRQVEPENRIGQVQPAAKAIAVGKAAGAVTILAHPARAGAEIASASDQTLLELVEMGLDGIEAYYPAHSPLETRHLVNFACRHNLVVSCGSDSHDERRKPVNWNSEFCGDLLGRLLQNQSLSFSA